MGLSNMAEAFFKAGKKKAAASGDEQLVVDIDSEEKAYAEQMAAKQAAANPDLKDDRRGKHLRTVEPVTASTDDSSKYEGLSDITNKMGYSGSHDGPTDVSSKKRAYTGMQTGGKGLKENK